MSNSCYRQLLLKYHSGRLLFNRYILVCFRKKSGDKLNNELVISNDNIPHFTLKGNVYCAKVTSVNNLKDFNICINYRGQLTRFSCQLFGINYEKYVDRGKGKDENKDLTDFLTEFLPDDNMVYIVANDFDPNGKLLVTMYRSEYLRNIGDMSINEQILIKNYINDRIDVLDPFFEIEL